VATNQLVPNPKDVGALYDQFDNKGVLHFGYWDSLDDDTPIEQAADRLTDQVAARLDLKPGTSLLDVGSGMGTPAVHLATNWPVEITGITISERQVRESTELAKAKGLADRVRFHLADAMRMPFPDASFDAAYALESIIHMDRPVALREMARVVRPGGRIVLTDLYDRTDGSAGERSLIHFLADAWLMSPLIGRDDYPGLAAEAGLEVVEVLDVSENVLWKTLSMLDQQLRSNDRSLVPDVIVDSLGEEQRDDLLHTPGAIENAKELGCLLVTLRRP